MGLTQNQVAEALGVTPGYISNVENNRTAMSLRILTYYAKLCGCSLDSLVDTADIDTIQKLCQKEKMHLRYESIGKNESKEITKLTYEQLCNSLKKGIYQVAFSIYRQGKD